MLDPIGGPIAVALAEELGDRAVLVTQDHIAGNELSRTGDLAPANVRLQQRGVAHRAAHDRPRGRRRDGRRRRRLRSSWRIASAASGARSPRAAVVDCGFRLPDDAAARARRSRAGDCVAPRTIHEAILEGRRAAIAL